MSATYIVGYRLGMIAAGAGSLVLASFFGGDEQSYNAECMAEKLIIIMALLQTLGV